MIFVYNNVTLIKCTFSEYISVADYIFFRRPLLLGAKYIYDLVVLHSFTFCLLIIYLSCHSFLICLMLCSFFLYIFLAAKCSFYKPLDEKQREGWRESEAFLPFTQNILRQPVPENLWPYSAFFADAPTKNKIVLPPFTSALI